jgi:hypothetical protein
MDEGGLIFPLRTLTCGAPHLNSHLAIGQPPALPRHHGGFLTLLVRMGASSDPPRGCAHGSRQPLVAGRRTPPSAAPWEPTASPRLRTASGRAVTLPTPHHLALGVVVASTSKPSIEADARRTQSYL